MDTIIINSYDRSIGSNISGRIDFNNSNKLNGSYKVINFIMTNNLYNINETNNKIYFIENPISYIATLPVGSYIASEMPLLIKTSLEIVGANTYTITYNNNTSKFSIISTGAVSFSFGSNIINSARRLLGFSENDTALNINQNSDLIIDLVPNKTIFLYLPEANNSTKLSNNITTSIYISTNSNFKDIIRKNFIDDNITLNFNNKINLSYKMHDEAGELLTNTNNAEWLLIIKKI